MSKVAKEDCQSVPYDQIKTIPQRHSALEPRRREVEACCHLRLAQFPDEPVVEDVEPTESEEHHGVRDWLAETIKGEDDPCNSGEMDEKELRPARPSPDHPTDQR
ncbi:MAG: hypothetical protein N2037_09830 [Acidimicrobiales bacterium]|nr:hypothetical protein [Acidimicrobiales bacterium]